MRSRKEIRENTWKWHDIEPLPRIIVATFGEAIAKYGYENAKNLSLINYKKAVRETFDNDQTKIDKVFGSGEASYSGQKLETELNSKAIPLHNRLLEQIQDFDVDTVAYSIRSIALVARSDKRIALNIGHMLADHLVNLNNDPEYPKLSRSDAIYRELYSISTTAVLFAVPGSGN